jgi:hypothetical protein
VSVAWKILCAIGVGLCVGSVAYAAAMGYDITNPLVWTQGISTFFDAPGVILGEAFGERPEAPLFQFISMASVGIVCLVASSMWWAVSALLPGLMRRSRGKTSTSSVRIEKKPTPRVATEDRSAEQDFGDDEFGVKSKATQSTAARIRSKLMESGKRDNFDSDIEQADSGGKLDGVVGLLKGLVKKKPDSETQERPENVAARSILGATTKPVLGEEKEPDPSSGKMILTQKGNRKKTARLTLQEKGSGAGILGTIMSAMEPLLSRLRSLKKPSQGDEEGLHRAQSAKNDALQTTLHQDIMGWFAAVQSGSLPQHELVQQAAHFAALLNPKERDAFTEEHSIDGAFVLRLIDSWSTRTDVGIGGVGGESEDTRHDDRQALRAAIRAVHMEKAGLTSIDEQSIPTEFNKSLDADNLEQPTHESDDDGIQDDVESPVYPVEEETDNESKMRASVEQLAQEMQAFTQTIRRCLMGETEWPDDLLYEDDREDEIERLDNGWGVISFTMSPEDVERIASEEGSEALDWLVRETSILDTGFKEFIRNLMESLRASNGEVDASDGWSDADVADPVSSVDPIILDEEETPDATATEEAYDGKVDEEVQPETEEEPTPTPSTHQVETAVDEDPVVSEADPEPVAMEPTIEPSITQEDTDVVQAEEADDEPTEAPHEEPQAQQPYTPVSLAKSDEEEVALADDAVARWGAILQECGATGGAIMKFVYKKNGAAVQPLGVIHVAALWKGRTNVARVNVMFRTLPEGLWSADLSTPGRFVNEKGDWVAVRESLFESVDFGNALLIIQLGGDGVFNVDEPLPESWGKGVWVVRGLPSKDAIVAHMDSAG